MSVPIIIDEWLFHDLSGDNGPEKQRQTWGFLFKLLQVCDRVAILEGSPFEIKFGQFIKNSGRYPVLREISKFLNNSIISNSLKTEFIAKGDVQPLPPRLAKLVPRDDHYLFQAHLKLKSQGSFIVTTDGRLKHKLLNQSSVVIKLRDQFVTDYLR